MSRQDRQSNHEKAARYVHPAIRNFMASMYQWIDTSKRQNFIGAEAAAFAKQSLPLYDWKGPGEVVKRQLIQTAPQVTVQQMVVPTGIAGIAAGQIYNGVLFDNPLTSDTLSGEIV